MAQHHAGWRGGSTADHVLVGATDVGGHDLENDTIIDFATGWIAEGWKIDLLNFDFVGLNVDYAAIRSHVEILSRPNNQLSMMFLAEE
jgi:hypothetical protein